MIESCDPRRLPNSPDSPWPGREPEVRAPHTSSPVDTLVDMIGLAQTEISKSSAPLSG